MKSKRYLNNLGEQNSNQQQVQSPFELDCKTTKTLTIVKNDDATANYY